MIRILTPLALIIALSSVSAAAQQSVSVKVADLDLNSVNGTRSLERRIDHAVHDVCDLHVSGRMTRQFDRACLASASTQAKDRVALLMSKDALARTNHNTGTIFSSR